MIPDDIHPIIDIDNYDNDNYDDDNYDIDNYDNYGIKMIWTHIAGDFQKPFSTKVT